MRRQKGFTLIELLIVVAIIGIIAAIAIPNMLTAINRGRQKRTMADIRSMATALEAYSVDFNHYPSIAATDTASWITYITPTYIRRLPGSDGWGNAFVTVGSTAGSAYTIWSKGRSNTGTIGTGGPTTSFDAAIVYTNGAFVQWPEGLQVQ